MTPNTITRKEIVQTGELTDWQVQEMTVSGTLKRIKKGTYCRESFERFLIDRAERKKIPPPQWVKSGGTT